MRKGKAKKRWEAVFLLIASVTFLHAQVWAAVAEVSWDPNPDPELSGYKVHYGVTSGNYQNVIETGKATTIEIDGLTPGQTYYFAVTACFNTDETEYSGEVSVSVPANATDGNTGGGGGGCFIQMVTFL